MRSISWCSDDTKLVTCGMDGAVYEWWPIEAKRINEVVLKTCAYSDITMSPSGKNLYAVGTDRTIKEIAESQVKLDFSIAVFFLNDNIFYTRCFCNYCFQILNKNLVKPFLSEKPEVTLTFCIPSSFDHFELYNTKQIYCFFYEFLVSYKEFGVFVVISRKSIKKK